MSEVIKKTEPKGTAIRAILVAALAAWLCSCTPVTQMSVAKLCYLKFSSDARAELKDRGEFTPKEMEHITSGRIYIGMREKALRCSWGRPDDINRSVGLWGTHSQYVYHLADFDAKYAYVENGVVTSWQD